MRISLIVIIILFTLVCTSAFGLGGPENVLVVQNGNSPMSQRICAHYVSGRSIPSGNVVTISCIDSSVSSANESISPGDYTTLIEEPIRSFMAANNLTNQIQYIVLTKGIPIKLTINPTGGQYGPQSVDSMLAAMDLTHPIIVDITNEAQQVVDTVYANQYWWSYAPFRHEDRGGYLVTRLDGYTEADAKTLVDHALAAPTNNRILLDARFQRGIPANQPKCLLFPDGTVNPDYQLEYADFDADLVRASQILAIRPDFSVTLDVTTTFMGSSEPLLGYVSWGSNDGYFSLSTYRSLTFTPRALADTAVSTSGRTFLPTTGGQSLIADLVAQGVSGAKGYASEPFLDAISSPTLLFDFYTSGKNLAESFYAASRFVKWKDIVLGDPLCRLEGTAAANIAAAKKLPNGNLVSLSGRIVTAGTEDFGDCFYIEDQNRASGIQVYIGNASFNILRGSVVNVRGALSTRNGERCIINPSID